jgi:putative tryptophan/tyrosine transport system substrate-binding protein
MQVIHGRLLHVDEGRNLTRHFFLLALVLSLAIAGTHAWPQRTNRLPIVAYLAHAAGPDDPIIMIWRQGLRDLGYVDGQNIKIEFRSAQGHPDRLPSLAEELVERNADVIFVPNVLGAQALRRATSTTPIVVALIDPVASGLVTNLARPDGNVTGLSSMTAELHSKRIQLLRETVPGLERVAVLWNPAATPAPVQSKFVEELKATARSLSIELKFVRAQSPDEFAPAFSAVNRGQAQALYVQENALFYVHRMRLAELAWKSRVPTIYGARVFAEEGGLMSYGVNWADQMHRSAGYIDRILKGAKPGDLPIEQATKLELVVNLKTAKALSLTIPQSILASADEVIR